MTQRFCLAILIMVSTAFGQSDFKHKEKIDELVAPWVEAEKVMAVSVGVIQNGKAWAGHYGRLSTDNEAQPTNKTIYEIGSISKVFTSVLLADAVNQGKVKLDDSIDSVMTELKEANPDVGSSITFKHLSQHMSGLLRMPINIAPADPMNPFDGYDRKLLTDYMKGVTPTRKPEAASEYSNLGAGLLGDLLARNAGVDYETLLKSRIAKPLKMVNTSLRVPTKQMGNFAEPYNAALIEDSRWDFQALAGAGGIRSTIVDMMRFMKANLKPSDDDIGKALDLAFKKQLERGKGHLAMGLGWMIAGDGSTRWHNGQTGGYQTMMLVSRKFKTGVVLLSNAGGSGVDQLGEQIFQACSGMDVKPKTFEKAADIDAAPVDRLAGKYQIAPGAFITVKTKRGNMMAQLTGQTFLSLKPTSPTEWKYDAVEATLKFDLPEKGASTKVTLFQNGLEIPANRIEK